ncbi:sensor histidine kinase [Nocardia panacis]|uniref:sensor histidine kinase n=1 Tax=Nocardia panacis TaxID=2340916 RepID=UPI001EF06E50|nr:sensor histidine kinase [Nocardia panacis]
MYLIGGCANAALVVMLLDRYSPGNRVGAAAAMAGIAIWYLVFGHAFLEARAFGPRAWLFSGGLIGLYVLGLYFAPGAVAVQPMVYPLLFMTLPLTGAVVAALLVNVLPIILGLIEHGPHSPLLPIAIAISLVALVMSPIIGVSMVWIGTQSGEQAALLDELAASREEVARLSRAAGTAAERARLAREIHDTLAQGLAGIVALAQTIEFALEPETSGQSPEPRLVTAGRQATMIRRTAQENLREARAMVTELTPTALVRGSLVESIRRHCGRVTDETSIAVTVTAAPELPELPMAVEVVLLRATQEALANIRKHSNATDVRVELSCVADVIRLTVTDNGIGFAPEQRHRGYGLSGMRERVAQIGGSVVVASRPGAGCSVCLEVPV